MKKKKFVMPTVKDSNVYKFRKEWLKKKIELVDITQHCEFKLGNSGWINNFSEPTENCYHIQVWYRDDNIAVFNGTSCYVIDDELYLIYVDSKDEHPEDHDFIIFRKVRL